MTYIHYPDGLPQSPNKVQWAQDPMRLGWGDAPTEADEHQAFLDEIGEAVQQWEQASVEHALASTRIRHLEVQIQALQAECFEAMEAQRETGDAMHRVLSGLCADAHQLLTDAGYVQVGKRLYRVDTSDGLSLHECKPLRIGGVGIDRA